MSKSKDLIAYLNPLAYLGKRDYSSLFPLITMTSLTVLIEIVFKFVLKDPEIVGLIAIVLYIGLIIYFSFRNGIRGGMTSVMFTIVYYLYIIYDRHYTGEELTSGLNTTFILGFLYAIIALIIGGLKQKIDKLVETEVNAKIRFMTIVQQLPVGLIIADTKGYITDVNSQFIKITGSKIKQKRKMGASLVPLRNPITDKMIEDENFPLMQALSKKHAVKNREFVIKDGSKNKYLLISSSPIFNQSNQVEAGVSIYQDVTAMREIEKRKDDFVSIASHELKTPVTSLVLYLDILKRRIRKGDLASAAKAVQNIERQTDNLTNLINNLLDVSRYQTGKMSYNKDEFRLDQLLEETASSLNDDKTKQEIIIKKTKKITVRADRYRIYQVMANLITNAVKYSLGKGDVEIFLTQSGVNAIVQVRDKGIGIPENQHKKIFEKLYQVRETSKGAYPGLGMGLYISREIVKRHGGKIWVESQEGKGSSFYFSLPIYKYSNKNNK